MIHKIDIAIFRCLKDPKDRNCNMGSLVLIYVLFTEIKFSISAEQSAAVMFCDIQLFSSNCNRILQVPKRGKHLSWIVFLRLQIGINNICNFAWQILRLSRQIK